MNDYLKNLTSNLPEQVVSPSSGNVYLVVAEKAGAKLAVSVMPTVNEKAKYKDKTIASAGLTVRFMEVPATPGDSTSVFTDFVVRGKDAFKHGEQMIHGLRGEKHYLPVCSFPCSPYEFLECVESQDCGARIAAWIAARVQASEGTLKVAEDALVNIVLSKMFEVPNEQVLLFSDPATIANPYKAAAAAPAAEPTDPSVQEFKDAFGKMFGEGKLKPATPGQEAFLKTVGDIIGASPNPGAGDPNDPTTPAGKLVAEAWKAAGGKVDAHGKIMPPNDPNIPAYEQYVAECNAGGEEPDSFEDWKNQNDL